MVEVCDVCLRPNNGRHEICDTILRVASRARIYLLKPQYVNKRLAYKCPCCESLVYPTKNHSTISLLCACGCASQISFDISMAKRIDYVYIPNLKTFIDVYNDDVFPYFDGHGFGYIRDYLKTNKLSWRVDYGNF